MTIYSAPLSDIEFSLNSFVDLPSIMNMSKPDGVPFLLILVLAAGDFLLLLVSRFKK